MAKHETIIFGPDHVVWRSLDDDDWNGATFSNFLLRMKNDNVILRPSPDHPRGWSTA